MRRRVSSEAEGEGKPRKQRRKAAWWELPVLVVLAIAVAIIVKTFIVQPFYIPSESMEHTLHGCDGCSGDRILVNKPVYDFRDPHPGDIVVFNAPPGWSGEDNTRPPSNPALRAVRGLGQLVGFVPPDGKVLVKRVIAVGGQTIKGTSSGAVFVRDGGPDHAFRKLNEPFVDTKDPTGPQPAFGPVSVPKGRLWVMGDHRTDSEDSRWHCSSDGQSDDGMAAQCATFARQATVPIDNVIGKAFVIAWPPSRWRTLGTPSTFEALADGAGSALPAATPVASAFLVFFVRRRPGGRKGRPGSRRRQ